VSLPRPWRGWFAASHPEFRRQLLQLARPRFCPADSVLYRADEQSHELFGLVSGIVEVQARLPHPDALLMHFIHPGHWFGGSPIVASGPRRVTARARTDTELLSVPGNDLRTLLAQQPQWWQEIGREVVFAFDMALLTASDLLIRDVSARCAAVVLRFADRRSSLDPDFARQSQIPAAQSELAMACNVSRNTFAAVLRRFEEAGWIRSGYRSILVLDPAALRRLADGA
jgi:CRP-like cAMP-binding protein